MDVSAAVAILAAALQEVLADLGLNADVVGVPAFIPKRALSLLEVGAYRSPAAQHQAGSINVSEFIVLIVIRVELACVRLPACRLMLTRQVDFIQGAIARSCMGNEAGETQPTETTC